MGPAVDVIEQLSRGAKADTCWLTQHTHQRLWELGPRGRMRKEKRRETEGGKEKGREREGQRREGERGEVGKEGGKGRKRGRKGGGRKKNHG